MSRYRVLGLAILALALAGQPALAQAPTIVYEFANATTGLPQATFSVLQGQKVSVRIYLHELTPNAPLLTDTGGMGSGAVRLVYAPTTTASVATATDILTGAAPNGPWTFGNAFIDTVSPSPPG